MYIPRKTSSATPSIKKPKPTKYELAREGQKVGNFKVLASPGFSIGSYHKFNFVKRGENIAIEYCKVCGGARKFLMIDGAEVSYVESALAKSKSYPIVGFNAKAAKDEFDTLLKREFFLVQK